MNIKRLFTDGKEIKKVSDLKNVEHLNKNYLTELYNAAEKNRKDEWGKDKQFVDDFVFNGKQWIDLNTYNTGGMQAFRAGKPVYYENLVNTFNYDNTLQQSRPRYSVNLSLSTIETLTAKFCSTDPIARTYSYSDSQYDIDRLRKMDLLTDIIFYKNNSFKTLYALILKEMLANRQAYLWIKYDEVNSKTHIPIKWTFLESDALLVDPEAVELDNANYIIHLFKMKYSELKYKYNYKPVEERENVDNDQIVEVKHWWFRVKLNGEYQWIMIPEYKNQYLKVLDEDGTPLDTEVYDYLPFQIFRGKQTKYWYGDNFILYIIPYNMMYNLVVTMENWNLRKVIDPPWKITGVKSDVVKAGDQPGGTIPIEMTQQATVAEQTLIPPSNFQTIKQMIKEEISDTIGDMGMFGGQNPTGVYSNKQLQTVKSMAELKPNMMQDMLFEQIVSLYEKSLKCLLHKGKTIQIYDPDFENTDGTFGNTVEIKEDDILNESYGYYVQVDDAKLLTKTDRLDAWQKILQYGNLSQVMPMSLILKTYDQIMNGLIPQNIIKSLEEKEKAQLSPSAVSQQSVLPPSPQGGSPLQAVPPSNLQPKEQSQEEITDEEFQQGIDKHVADMQSNGVPDKQIFETLTAAGITLSPDGTTATPAEGQTKEDILATLEFGLVNKTNNIFGKKF